jgi:DNA-binding beta-propeller fold protein YncE
MYDLDSEYFGTFGSWGEGDGQFVWPTAIAVDGLGQVYIADEYTHRVVVFDPAGNSVANWGVHGARPGELDGPSGLAFDHDDSMYVVDHQNHRVQKFTTDGRFLLEFGSEGPGAGQLNLPWGLTVDARGEVYVADWRNDRVQRFSPSGEFLGVYGSSGRGDGQLFRPSSVAVDDEGYVYVADWGNERVQVLDPEGGFVMKLRGSATLSKWADDFLSTNVEEAQARASANLEPDIERFGGDPHEESAHVEKLFWAPVSVKLDGDGRLYVTESNRHRVQVFERGS